MLKKISAMLAAIVAMIGLSAVPAQASSYAQCGDKWICFYNYANHNPAGGVWGHRIYDGYNTCITMPSSGTSFTNGTAYNAATSIVINNGGTNTLEIYAHFFDGYDCYWPGLLHVQEVDPNSLNLAYLNLANVPSFSGGGSVNDRIGSYMITSWY